MEWLVASLIGVLIACGIYLCLRARSFDVALGVTLLSYAVNVFIFASGRLVAGAPPIVGSSDSPPADPLPQALVLTAIVIGLGMTAVTVALAAAGYAASDSDHVDGSETKD